MSYPERIIPDETEHGVVAHHLKRYAFALPYCEGREVLDAACGVGYGTAFVAEHAARAVGIDVDADAIAYARNRYARENVEYFCGDVRSLPFADATFDTVCSFETVEHLDDPHAFVREVARVLRDNGTLVVSTPCVERTTHSPENPHHRVELAPDDFASLLGAAFGDVELYGQRRRQTRAHRFLRRADVLGVRKRLAFVRRAARITGTPAVEHATLDDIEIVRDELRGATEVVAVCRA